MDRIAGRNGMMHKRFADNRNEESIATRLRRQRFQILLTMLNDGAGHTSILDIGGTFEYWDMMTAGQSFDPPLQITMLNTSVNPKKRPNFTSLVGDGRAMPQFANQEFDIVFSNSTNEHVGSFEDQQRMAEEVRRVGRRYFI